jgi:hypothetical protein
LNHVTLGAPQFEQGVLRALEKRQARAFRLAAGG